MLTAEQNDRLTRVGPGTPCGELMRRYWHPVAASSQLPEPGTKLVRILGEDLVLYRDRSGGMGLVATQCAHRRAALIYGIPEETGLRCMYHGWLYDKTGQCTEQPYDMYLDETSTFKDKIRITAYPVEELGGLVFAYLGPEPRPLLPRWEAFVLDPGFREIGMAYIPCNWLQTVENAGDSSHVVYTHWGYSRFVFEKLGMPDMVRHEGSSGARGFVPRRHKEITTPHGLGAVLFPYIDAQNDMTYQIRVPVDDTTTLHIWYSVYTPEAQAELGVDLPEQDPLEIPTFHVPVPTLDANGIPQYAHMDGNSDQDLAMWYTQGPIMDRTAEHLSVGDEHIIHQRRLLDEQIRIVEDGGDPINTFRNPNENVCLVPEWSAPMPPRITPDGRPDRTNAARKYSVVYTKATVAALGESALAEPVH